MEIRCPNCNKKLGNRVLGLYVTDCPRCHNQVRIIHTGREIVTHGGKRILVVAEPHTDAQPQPPAQKAA